jgi:hypothetical protein
LHLGAGAPSEGAPIAIEVRLNCAIAANHL